GSHATQCIELRGPASAGAIPGESEIGEALATLDTTVPTAARDVDRHSRLERAWHEPTGFFGWFTVVNHKHIGKRFIVTAFIFFLLGGLLAVLMRLQLARPDNTFLSADKYNQIFTMHGSTMMFLFAVPMMFEALSVYVVPLMVGA